MILIDSDVSELSAGCAVISEFIITLETTWLPGFERSYTRRQAEYLKAIQKHEERGLFLRTLLRTPKPPNRPPPGYRKEVGERLYSDWQDSFTGARPFAPEPLLIMLSDAQDDDSFLLTRLHLLPNMLAQAVLLAPSGITLFAAMDGILETESSPNALQRMWQQTAVEIGEVLHNLDWSGAPNTLPIGGGILLDKQAAVSIAEDDSDSAVPAAEEDFWRKWLLANSAQSLLSEETLYAAADALLARHHAISQTTTFSAQKSAEKLTKREKDNLLRMAATL